MLKNQITIDRMYKGSGLDLAPPDRSGIGNRYSAAKVTKNGEILKSAHQELLAKVP